MSTIFNGLSHTQQQLLGMNSNEQLQKANTPIILMELMDMNLRDAYTRGKVKGLQVLGILCDVAKALHFLHTRPDLVI